MAATACTDNPVNPGDDHAHADGMEITIGGEVVVAAEGGQVDGRLTVQAGRMSPRMQVTFLDHDGEPISVGDDVFLDVVIARDDIAVFHQDTPGGFTGRLEGVSPGTASAVFQLKHGAYPSGHSELSVAVDVVVTP
jgi:hypothetical protein